MSSNPRRIAIETLTLHDGSKVDAILDIEPIRRLEAEHDSTKIHAIAMADVLRRIIDQCSGIPDDLFNEAHELLSK